MARSRSPRPPTAYITSIAKPRLVRLPAWRPLRAPLLSPLADRRQWHPVGPYRPVVASPRSAGRVVLRRPKASFALGDVFGFAAPKKVSVCVRRAERREVLFAKRRTRSGGSKRRNYWSSVSCKR